MALKTSTQGACKSSISLIIIIWTKSLENSSGFISIIAVVLVLMTITTKNSKPRKQNYFSGKSQ